MGNTIEAMTSDEKNRVLNLLQMYTNGSLTAEGQRIGVVPLLLKMVSAIRQFKRNSLTQVGCRC